MLLPGGNPFGEVNHLVTCKGYISEPSTLFSFFTITQLSVACVSILPLKSQLSESWCHLSHVPFTSLPFILIPHISTIAKTQSSGNRSYPNARQPPPSTPGLNTLLFTQSCPGGPGSALVYFIVGFKVHVVFQNNKNNPFSFHKGEMSSCHPVSLFRSIIESVPLPIGEV